MAFDWRVYGPDTVLSRVDQSHLEGFFAQVVVRPFEAAILVRDGDVTRVVTHGRGQLLGFLDVVRRVLGLGPQAEAIYVTTAPLQITYYVGEALPIRGTGSSKTTQRLGDREADLAKITAAQLTVPTVLTKDSKPIYAEISLAVRVDTNAAELVLQLLHGRSALSKSDLAGWLKSQFVSNVLNLEMSKYSASETRGSRELIVNVNEAIRREMEAGLRNLGLVLEGGVAIEWGLTDAERDQVELHRQQQALDTAKRQIASEQLTRAPKDEPGPRSAPTRVTTVTPAPDAVPAQQIRRFSAGGSDPLSAFIASIGREVLTKPRDNGFNLLTPRGKRFGYARLNKKGHFTVYCYPPLSDPEKRFIGQPKNSNDRRYSFGGNDNEAFDYASGVLRTAYDSR